MFTLTQMQLMMDLQNRINSQIDPDWLNTANPFMLAASQEFGEAIDHYGWKWWKKQDPDMAQVRMEMVDIWHFMLSQIMLDIHNDPDKPTLEDYLNYSNFLDFKNIFDIDNLDLLPDVELMRYLQAGACVDVVNVPIFLHLCLRFGLPESELMRLYVGKNILNTFRQNNGYKQGTYIKVWSGKEDNEYLTDIMSKLSLEDPDIETKVMTALEDAYKNYA